VLFRDCVLFSNVYVLPFGVINDDDDDDDDDDDKLICQFSIPTLKHFQND